jgi:glycosyltransferase involved in cell wall biosynthesis
LIHDMSNRFDSLRKLRILSIVEALTVTGPVKPLLTFASVTRERPSSPKITHFLLTTRRGPGTDALDEDELFSAANQVGIHPIAIAERMPFDPFVLGEMHRAIVEARPDIVETHNFKSHLLFFLLRSFSGELRKAKWVAFHHGYTRTSWRVRLYQQLDRLTLRRANHVITMCKPFANTLLEDRGVRSDNLSVISNAITDRPTPSDAAISRARELKGIAEGDCLIVFIGRLSVEKGGADLLEAFHKVVDASRNQSVRLLFVGDGPERERLQKLAIPLGDAVQFAGHVTDPWPLFHAADIFVLPSHSEGSPLVVLEAMAAGLPIVAASVGGIPELLTDKESALLVPPRSPLDMAAALRALVEDEMLRERIGEAATLALSRFSPEAYADRLLSIYGGLLT